jgi:2-polyprenyl-3-methyl-5-hydroxy-6-metoxy-1,4-benzoquinol methylase
MLPFVPRTTRTLLDIGCGRGAVGSNVKVKQGATGWGVEIVAEAARIAMARLDRVVQADIGQALDTLPQGHFDCVTFNDVLEHLVDPYSVVANVKRLLAPGGVLVASLPNVRYFPVAWDLIWRGRWDYRDCGVLDRTHLRFFTPASMRSLFEERGYGVTLTGINASPSPLARVAARLAPTRFRDMQFVQYAIVAKPTP